MVNHSTVGRMFLTTEIFTKTSADSRIRRHSRSTRRIQRSVFQNGASRLYQRAIKQQQRKPQPFKTVSRVLVTIIRHIQFW
ncbi:hypothetical protein DXD75_05420 [Bifidobacterium pseudocatenulatum]|nr:hypothetical protein DXD75_05420 [Bifidobacterium pseudocatenulatum]